MSLDETLKKVLGDDVFKEKGSELKKELAKEMIPKTEFNDKLEVIKGLESAKSELEKKVEEKDNANLTELQKLQKNMKALEDKLTKESELRTQSENLLAKSNRENSLKEKFANGKLNSKYFNFALKEFENVNDEDFDAKFKDFSENYKEWFGENKLDGKKPDGSFEENNNKPKTFNTLQEWKDNYNK